MSLRDNLKAGRKPKIEAREAFKSRWRDKIKAKLDEWPEFEKGYEPEVANDMIQALGIQHDEVGNPAMIAILVLQIIREILKARNAK